MSDDAAASTPSIGSAVKWSTTACFDSSCSSSRVRRRRRSPERWSRPRRPGGCSRPGEQLGALGELRRVLPEPWRDLGVDARPDPPRRVAARRRAEPAERRAAPAGRPAPRSVALRPRPVRLRRRAGLTGVQLRLARVEPGGARVQLLLPATSCARASSSCACPSSRSWARAARSSSASNGSFRAEDVGQVARVVDQLADPCLLCVRER